MALSIKDERTDRLVRRYAKLHGTTFTGAINRAVKEALCREGAEDDADDKSDFLTLVRDVQRQVAALPMLDGRHPDEILYDDDGLPK